MLSINSAYARLPCTPAHHSATKAIAIPASTDATTSHRSIVIGRPAWRTSVASNGPVLTMTIDVQKTWTNRTAAVVGDVSAAAAAVISAHRVTGTRNSRVRPRSQRALNTGYRR